MVLAGVLSRVLLAAAVLVAIAMVALIVSVAGKGGNDGTRAGTAVAVGLEQASLKGAGGASRSVFKHSVIPGGVFTPEELQTALAQDAVAAEHYKSLNTSAVRTETVKADRLAYVSYRKGDQIYWTRNKVRLKQGETILTDGTNEVRARCGNCISETPRLPVAAIEPATAELDRLVDDPGAPQPSLSAAIRDALESSLFGWMGAGSAGAGNAVNGSAGAGGIGSAGSGASGGGGSASARSADPTGSSGGSGGSPLETPAGAASLADPVGAALAPEAIVAGGGGTSLPDPKSGGPSSDRPESPSEGNPNGSPFVGGSTPGQSPSGPTGAPDSPSVGSPGVPQLIPPTGPAGVLPGAPNTGNPPVTGNEVPPGIDLPPGLNPGDTVQPLATPSASSPEGPDGGQGGQAEIASIPEPGSLLLLGGGAAVALLRRRRGASRSR